MRSTLLSARLRKKRHKQQARRRRRAHPKATRHRHPHVLIDENVAWSVQPPAQPPKPNPNPPAGGKLPPPPDASHRNAERLLWRAGFGPKPGAVDHVVSVGIEAAVRELTRPSGAAKLTGPAPVDDDGNALAPADAWGHDHLWWLDRMVRSDQQLVERMTLIWHDWFATSNDGVGSARLMLDQNELFRSGALGSFKDLLRRVTKDPAMLIWLNGVDNRKRAANENYARELMELFTLGADRGAYTEQDVRQLALALTGWRADWVDPTGWENFRYDDTRHDHSTKTVFGKSSDFDWQAAVQLVLENPFHASFFVTKLWSYFVPTPPDAATQAALQKLYLDSGYGIRPVVEAILMHPDLHTGPAMVKPPVVYAAGLLRGQGRTVATGGWTSLCADAGQQLFFPPNVSGWDDSAWLDTSTWKGRFQIAVFALSVYGDWGGTVNPWKSSYSKTENPETAVARALDFTGNPVLTDDTRVSLLQFARTCLPATMASWEQGPYRAMRQNALRQLVATCPDHHVS
jgi:uncharacterized protein (DUF1800 family)